MPKNKFFLVSLFILLLINGCNNPSTMVIGKWIAVKVVYNNGKTEDPDGIWIEFKNDNSLSMGGPHLTLLNGKWKYNKGYDSFTFSFDVESKYAGEHKILKLNSSQMVLEWNRIKIQYKKSSRL